MDLCNIRRDLDKCREGKKYFQVQLLYLCQVKASEMWFLYFRKGGGKCSIVSVVAHHSQSICCSSGYNDLTLHGPDARGGAG